MDTPTVQDLRVAWRVLRYLVGAGYLHASEGLRAVEGWMRQHHPTAAADVIDRE